MQIRVGTRGSPLALAQTEIVLSRLRELSPGDTFVIEVMQSSADKAPDTPLASLPRGVFAEQLEAALADDNIDMAVHSFKDLPVDVAEGFAIAAMVERGDPRDALVAPGFAALAAIPLGGRIGTSSPRRAVLLRGLRPDLDVVPIRGNVGTRVKKAEGDGLAGVVVAAAGLSRLGLTARTSEVFDPATFVPEAGQGVLAVEIRSADHVTARLVRRANDLDTWSAVAAETGTIRALGGGCTVPIAAYAQVDGESLVMHGIVSDGGSRLVRANARGKRNAPEALGVELAQCLNDLGAAEILAAHA